MDVACKSQSLYLTPKSTTSASECQSVSYGVGTALTSDVNCLEVCIYLNYLHAFDEALARDPNQHSSLKAEIEAQSTALYSTARLWDDGIIQPTETRDVVGLALALGVKGRSDAYIPGRGGSSTWEGSGRGFGVFRM